MADVIKTTFQLRRGEASVWKKNNPTLAKGEPGVELDTLKMKIGDGATPWNDLPYNAGATDWNELENRPFGAETTVLASWDGNTDNVEIFDASTYASAAPTTYKISDDILTVEDILGSTVSFPAIGIEAPVEALMEPAPGMVVLGEQFVMLVSSEEIGVPLGVYATMPFSIYKENTTKIDEKYLPSGIVTQDNISEYLPSGIVTQDNISEYMPEEITSKLLPNTPNQSDTTVKYYPYYSVNNSRWYANANFIELRTKYGVTYIKPSDFISSDPVLSTSHNGGSGTRISPIDIKLYDPTVKKDTYLQLKRSAITFKANNSTHTVSINWDDTDGSLKFNHTLPNGSSSGQTSLKNIATPVNAYDAVNKEYVDNLIGGIENGTY